MNAPAKVLQSEIKGTFHVNEVAPLFVIFVLLLSLVLLAVIDAVELETDAVLDTDGVCGPPA